MSILSDPDQDFPIVLDRDKDKPKETRPTFFAKACSAREQRKMYKLLDKWEGLAYSTDDNVIDQLFDQTFDQLNERLTDWKNVKVKGKAVPFNGELLEDALTLQEARELLALIRDNQFVKENEKKSSES